MSAPPGSAPAPPFAQTPQFWVLMVYALGLGVFGAVAALLFMGLIGFGNNWYTASDPGWFGGQWWWVGRHGGRGSRGRPPAPVDPPSSQDPEPDRRPRARARRPPIGAGDRGRLGRVVDRRRQPGPGAGARVHGRRGRRVGLAATTARRRGRQGEHAGRVRRRLRRVVLQHGDRGHADLGGRPPGRTAHGQDAGRHDRLLQRLVRDLLRRRGRLLPRRLSGALVHVRGLAAAGRYRPGPVRGGGGDAAGHRDEAGSRDVRPAQGAGHRSATDRRPGVRRRRRDPAADDVHRQ